MANPKRYDPWFMLRWGIALLVLLFFVSTAAYWSLGEYWYHTHWSLMDCAFMVSITLSTIGYGDWLDIHGKTAAEIYTMFLALAGIGVPAFLISTFTALIVEGVIGDTVRRRRMQQEIAAMSGHVIVCGAGATGMHCIDELLRIGRKFVAVDVNAEHLKDLQTSLGQFPYIVGSGDRDEVLLAAGIMRAEGLLVCLREDKDNLFITLTARVLNPDIRIASKGVDDHVRKKMVMAGANAVVNPTAIGGLRLVSELIRPATVGFLDSMMREKTATRFGELVLEKNSVLRDKTLAEADLRHRADVLIVAARHPGVETFIYNPKADFLLEANCVVVVMGPSAEIEKLRPVFLGN